MISVPEYCSTVLLHSLKHYESPFLYRGVSSVCSVLSYNGQREVEITVNEPDLL